MLFVHVQKTGGSSVEVFLDRALDDVEDFPSEKHHTLAQLLRKHPEFRSYWIFGFVRNPWARVASWWAMILRVREEHPENLAANPFWEEAAKLDDFEDFVLRGTDQFDRMRRPQVTYLTTPTRRADFVGRTETFEADLRAVAARLDVPFTEVPRENVSSSYDWREWYTPAAHDRVAEIFRRDVDTFGYSFDR
jgi:hypothetical protein